MPKNTVLVPNTDLYFDISKEIFDELKEKLTLFSDIKGFKKRVKAATDIFRFFLTHFDTFKNCMSAEKVPKFFKVVKMKANEFLSDPRLAEHSELQQVSLETIKRVEDVENE